MRKVVLKDHPWPSTITIVVGSVAELDRFIERHSDFDGEMETCRGRHFGFVTAKGRHDIIAVKQAFDRADRISTLAHEAVHVAYALLDDHAGMPLKRKSEEAYAYLIGWIVKMGLPIL